jgi:hypothetical protein
LLREALVVPKPDAVHDVPEVGSLSPEAHVLEAHYLTEFVEEGRDFGE